MTKNHQILKLWNEEAERIEWLKEDALDGLRDLDAKLADRIAAAIEEHLDADRDRDYDYWREEADLHYRRTRGV